MASKIKVYGKAQSRTVLGIVNAYLILHPESTLEDLNKAFPESLSSKKGDSLFADMSRKKDYPNLERDYFEREDETIKLADGTVLALVEVWTKADFDKAVEIGKEYGIEVAEFEKTSRPGERGGFRLEALNGFDLVAAAAKAPVSPNVENGDYVAPEPTEEEAQAIAAQAFSAPAPTEKKVKEVTPDDTCASCKCKWIPVLFMLLLFCGFMFKACDNGKDFVCGTTEYNETPDEETLRQMALIDSLRNDSILKAQAIADSIEALADTIPDALVQANNADEVAKAIADNIEKGLSTSFNNIKFDLNSATLSPESNETLNGLVKYMKENPDAKMKVVGHASADGPEEINLKLSKERAKAVVDYLEANGIEKIRLSYQGKGSSRPISDNPEENRRVEIKIKK
ncbi:MAG: OmpA family protein [Paludibacteraceae bacterium]|nr:OmpA family protein [Paludibacteraceae bacterium]